MFEITNPIRTVRQKLANVMGFFWVTEGNKLDMKYISSEE